MVERRLSVIHVYRKGQHWVVRLQAISYVIQENKPDGSGEYTTFTQGSLM